MEQSKRKESEISVEFSDNEESPEMIEHHRGTPEEEEASPVEEEEPMVDEEEGYLVNLEKIYL